MLNVATVTQIDYPKGMIKVELKERGNVESNWVSVPSFEYDMPKVNDTVMVSFDEENLSSGICHGKYFNAINMPIHNGPTTYYKTMCEDVVLKYDSSSKLLEIFAVDIKIVGNVEIIGNLDVVGEITATGSVTGNPLIGCPKCE